MTERIVVVGAGMAGILAAIKLREAGYDDFAVYEKAGRVGGTWRENTYPGIACDVPSHLYSYSFAPQRRTGATCSRQGAEIQAYFEAVADDQGVAPLITFGAEVERMVFDSDAGCWDLEIAGGRRDDADVVIAATGVLHHPNLPTIDGIDTFAGRWFHSARWDHDVPLDGRRVGIVGTGSSAVQIVRRSSDRVAELHLFQRTAQWVLQVANPAIAEDERSRLHRTPLRSRRCAPPCRTHSRTASRTRSSTRTRR